MKRNLIPINDFVLPAIELWTERWMLLAAGNRAPGQFNIMTVAWGSFGVMWSKPFVMVAVRPTRHTYGFMEKSASFSVSVLPLEFRDKMLFCGSHSGKDVDKVKACGFAVVPLDHVEAPGFDEAELTVECRKMYADDFSPAQFLIPEIATNYKENDYHRMYFGEILAIHGTDAYVRKDAGSKKV